MSTQSKVIRNGLILVILSLPVPAFGSSPEITPNTTNIRAVQTDSTDIFQVLSSLREADTALAERDYASARRGYESVLMHDPALQAARSGLRRTLIAIGDAETAARWIDDQNSADAIIINILRNEIAEPEAALRATLKLKSDPRLWTLLGRLQDKAGDFSAARQAYAMAGLAGARPGLAENNIGHSHWLAEETEAALESFTAAAAADPADTQFDNNRRRALITLGQTQNAVAGLDSERAAVFLAQAADRAASEGEVKLAQYLYRKSLDLAPRHNPHVARKLAQLDARP